MISHLLFFLAEREGFEPKIKNTLNILTYTLLQTKNTIHLTKRATFTCKDSVYFNISQVSYCSIQV